MSTSLVVERRGRLRYAVVDPSGSGEPRLVDLSVEPPTCSCPHHRYRGAACKHLTTARHYRRPVTPELRAIGEELAGLSASLGTLSALEARAKLDVLHSWFWQVRREDPGDVGRRWWRRWAGVEVS